MGSAFFLTSGSKPVTVPFLGIRGTPWHTRPTVGQRLSRQTDSALSQSADSFGAACARSVWRKTAPAVRRDESEFPIALGGLRHSFGFDAQRVVDGLAQLLFASEVAFRGLDRHVSQEELNLIQLTSRQMAQARAGAA